MTASFFCAVADQFRSLNQVGRRAIALRNEQSCTAMKAQIREAHDTVHMGPLRRAQRVFAIRNRALSPFGRLPAIVPCRTFIPPAGYDQHAAELKMADDFASMT